jgi:signal transduction histidine kinase/CheY-like chemotaxis protein
MKNYNFVTSFFVISYTLGLYVSSTRVENTLRIIGQVLVQHNHSFMIYNNKVFKPVCIIVSLIIVNSAQNHLRGLILDNNIPAILDIVHRLQYSWGPLYIFNQFCAMHFAKNYARVLKQAEDTYKDLEKTNEELCEMNHKMKNTMTLLEEKNKELNAAIKTRELFIAGVSHEFRNPLNSMMGNIELLSLEIKDPKWKEMLDTCKICGDVLLGLINNILDVAKINAEKLELNFQPVNFYRLIEKVWSVCAIKIREKGLRGHLSISGDLPQYLEMDTHRLNQILLNIIGNATKFTSRGFVKINISWHTNKGIEELRGAKNEFFQRTSRSSRKNTIMNNLSTEENLSIKGSSSFSESTIMEYPDSDLQEIKHQLSRRMFSAKTLSDLKGYSNQILLTENDKIIEKDKKPSVLSCQKEEGILKIEVCDTGCGISSCALEKLFQPFTQADSSITRRFGGTGLGLYISKQLIQKMNGEIHSYSEEHAGTNFCILIPTQSAAAQDVEELIQEDNIIQKGEDNEMIRALVVDDIFLNQILMTQYLKKMNIQVDVANNGEEAVQKFQEKGFGYYSFISMDIQMPVMDGLTASKHIRKYETQRGYVSQIPIMMVTGNCTEMEKNYCLDPKGEIRASHFFRKPFVFEECKACVKSLLNKKY